MLETPIFHVNGDDPEAVWFVSKVATEYRQKFKKDVFIDLVCYRKHGHNEGDEPSYTQPLLYRQIKDHVSTRQLYSERLVGEGVLTAEAAQAAVDGLNAKFTEAQTRTREEKPRPRVSVFENARWKGLKRPTEEDIFKPVDTSVPAAKLRELAERINHVPAGFHMHPKLNRFFDARLGAIHEGKDIDWGNGEALAYASLLDEGTPVRLSGQDAERGTFSHRHSVLYDFDTGESYVPLSHVRDGQAPYRVHNSHLSEMAVLGFEYGFSLADPATLVIWEAQFGDFANGAQVIIDQFIASSGEQVAADEPAVLLLAPRLTKARGPEHSSARLERFLQLAGRQQHTRSATSPRRPRSSTASGGRCTVISASR